MGQEKQWAEFEPVYYDDLTEILSKRFMLNARSFIDGDVSLAFFDIDNFKYVNDVHGHYAGDKVIQEIGMLLKSYSRKGDYPIRFGGDEFIFISTAKRADELKDTMENLGRYVASRPFIFQNKSVSITLSFGIAEGRAEDMESIMQNADFALYCSKEKGKNCATLYTKRESGGLYMPLREEREIKKSIAGLKPVIIKGGFKSGKTTLKNKLKAEFPKVEFRELDDFRENKESLPNVIFYNPATIESDKKINRFLYSFKQREHDEYWLSNFSRNDMVRLLELAGIKATLFMLNYLEFTTNGNPFLVSKFVSSLMKKRFDTLTDYSVQEELASLSDSALKSLKRVNKLGLEINLSDAAESPELYKDVMHLLELGILVENRFSLNYSYPCLYFALSDGRSITQSQKKMLDLARKRKICDSSSDMELSLSTALLMYNFGDMEEASSILGKSGAKGDDVHSLKARILIAESDFNSAEREIELIKDPAVRSQAKVLRTVSTSGELQMEKLDDPYTNILYTSYCIRKQSFDMVEEFVRNIDQTVLTQKEYVSHLSNLANYYMFRQREKEAVDCFLKCEEICKKELFLADLGKVYMMMGNMFDQKDELFKALEYFNKAMEIFPYTSMNSIVWSINLNLAVTYLKLGEFTKSLDMFTSLLSMERENDFYKMVVYNNLADAYIRMHEWDNAEYYNDMVISLYKGKSSLPDCVVFQNRKIKRAKNSAKWLKLDYFNKDDIISNLDSMVLDFVRINSEPDFETLKNFTGRLLNAGKKEEMLYKAELLAYMAYIYRKNERLKLHLIRGASNIFLSLNLELRDNMLKKNMENG
ncbi:MAG: diguanylate cyclase [bacterium]|nr:diguanylate cyclase [bacterium]